MSDGIFNFSLICMVLILAKISGELSNINNSLRDISRKLSKEYRL